MASRTRSYWRSTRGNCCQWRDNSTDGCLGTSADQDSSNKTGSPPPGREHCPWRSRTSPAQFCCASEGLWGLLDPEGWPSDELSGGGELESNSEESHQLICFDLLLVSSVKHSTRFLRSQTGLAATLGSSLGGSTPKPLQGSQIIQSGSTKNRPNLVPRTWQLIQPSLVPWRVCLLLIVSAGSWFWGLLLSWSPREIWILTGPFF